MLFHIIELVAISCANQGTRSCSRTPAASLIRFGWRTVCASGMHKVGCELVNHLSAVVNLSIIWTCQLIWISSGAVLNCPNLKQLFFDSSGADIEALVARNQSQSSSSSGRWEKGAMSDSISGWQNVLTSGLLLCSWAWIKRLSALQGGVQTVDQTICSGRFMFDTWAFAGICQVVCWSAHNSAVKTWLDWLIPLQCKWTCFDIVFIIFIIFDSKRLHSIGHVSPRQLLMLGCQLCSQMQSVVSLCPFFHACFRCSLSKTQFTRKMKVSVSCKLSFGLLRSGGTSVCAAEPCPAPCLTL